MNSQRHRAYMPVIRQLIECARAFEHFSDAHVRAMGLTGAQFDIIATLGNTPGMTCKELGEKTLITKGTMTGVLDRLAAKGLLVRRASPDDGRSWITALTDEGQALFEKIFPAHMEYMDPVFGSFSEGDLRSMQKQLVQLRNAFANPAGSDHGN